MGTAYGALASFTTTASVIDIDGNEYPIVQIGTQVWMAANLKTTRYRNGSSIPNVMNGVTWLGLTSGAWSYYDNNMANDPIYGKLYNWFAVNDNRKLCPTGWHVPTDAEWMILSNNLGIDDGFKMKSTVGWNDNGNGSDTSGFKGLPSGMRRGAFSGVVSGTFGALGTEGSYWSSSLIDQDGAWMRYLRSQSRSLSSLGQSLTTGLSVRCLRD
jgi:uncharacterized protein (TIGR02145 family)